MESRADSCSVAFKEWAGVRDALADGRQTILLRKGGISEASGPGQFQPEHDTFWIYPTAVHQAQQGLRPGVSASPPDVVPGAPTVPIGVLARVERIGRIEDEAMLPALEPYHVLTADTVRARFHYRNPGLWVLAVRIWRRVPPHTITTTAEHAGCKTWVVLDEPLSTDGLTAALDDREWAARLSTLNTILGEGSR